MPFTRAVVQIADEVVSKWQNAESDDHFPLGENMFLYSGKGVLVSLLGDKFKDDKEALTFKRHYDVVFEEMEQRLSNPILPKEDSVRQQEFKKGITL
jgi:hypothetical protein